MSSPSTNLPRGFLPPDPRVEEPYRVTPQAAIRIAILGVVAVTIFCALFFRLWALQVISGERYLEVAKNNQVRTFRAPAPRGSILDRNGVVLVSNKPGTAVQLWPAAFEQATPERQAFVVRSLATLLHIPYRDIRADIAARKGDLLTPITIKENVKEDKINYLLEHQNDFPGVQINQTYQRHYDDGGIAAQTLGYVSEISQQQLDAADGKGGYAAGDRIGQTGVEATYDAYLRGLPGIGRVFVDALGRVTSARQFQQLPEAGDNVRLTIDADLQKAAEDALAYGIRLAHDDGQWAADGGALVAMDPQDRRDPRSRLQPDVRPERLHGPGRAKKDLAQLADPTRQPPDARPRRGRRLSAGLDLQAGDRPCGARDGHPLADGAHPVHAEGGRRRADLHELGSVRERADDPDHRARRLLRHLLLPGRTALLRTARTRRSRSGRGRWASARRRDRHRSRRERDSSRRPPGGAATSRPRSTRSGRRATRCSSASARATCSSRRSR